MKEMNGENLNEFENEITEHQIAQIEEELIALRKKDRRKNVVFGLAVGIFVIFGAGSYISNATAKDTSWDDYAQQAYNTQYTGSASSGGGCGGGSGGGCGGGGSAAGTATATGTATSVGSTSPGTSARSGGCCGGGGAGSAATPESLADLEKQGLALYKEENKNSSADVTAKAGDFGCHTQIDILDADGNIVRSYGYQGNGLYVIR